MTKKCSGSGCPREASGIVGLQLFPFKALMDYYKNDKPLSELMLIVDICPQCLAGLQASDLIFQDDLDALYRLVTKQTQTAVDPKGSKLILIPYDDPKYLKLLQDLQKAKDSRPQKDS